MKTTKSQLKQIIREELEDTLNEEKVPSFRDFLGFLGLGLATIAGGLAPVYNAIPDSSPEDSAEKVEVLKNQAAEHLVANPEKAKEAINKFGYENEEIKDVFTRYNKVRAAGGYTDEPNPASSWKENRMKITKSQLKQIIKEELKKALAEASTITDPSGEHARTYRSSEDEQKRYLRKAKQDAAALKSLKDTDPEEYERLVAKKKQDRESFRARSRSASNKDKVAIRTFKNIIQDLMDKGFSLEDAANRVRSNNPDAVAAAVAELKPEPE